MEGMSQEMLRERKKKTGLTWAWMLFNRNQQTQEQELGGSWHILLSQFGRRHRVDWQTWTRFSQHFAFGEGPQLLFNPYLLIKEELNLQPPCTSLTEHRFL